MKMTKGELKSLVKECLVEVLTESFGINRSSGTYESNTSPKGQQMKLNNRNPSFTTNKKVLDSPIRENKVIESTIKTGDPVMDAIFADTARTTLPTLVEAENNKHTYQPHGSIERIVAESEPEALFGEDAAAKWADLAFGDFSKKV